MKEINKSVFYSDDNDIVGYYFDGDCFFYPMTKGSIRRAPKEMLMILLKSALIWATFFLVILPGIAWIFIDYDHMIGLYGWYWEIIVFIGKCFKGIGQILWDIFKHDPIFNK